MPCVAVCLRDSVLCSVDGEPWVTTRGEPGFGRENEKLCRLELLLLACDVNCEYIGVAGDATRWRDLATLIEGAPVDDIAAAWAAAVLAPLLAPSSDPVLESVDSSRRGGGGRRESETGRCLCCNAALAAAAEDDADGDAAVLEADVSGEKLPGARPCRPAVGAPGPCVGCIVTKESGIVISAASVEDSGYIVTQVAVAIS